MEPIALSMDDVAPLAHIAPGVSGLRIVFVNVFGIAHASGWTLVDAGLTLSASRIKHWAKEQFGGAPPKSIILTHGHFDHVGVLKELAEEWNVLVYAHPIELPYITGQQEYLPPDPTVGGGIMPWMSPLFPRSPIDLGARAAALPLDNSVPDLPGWRWIHTPGHAPGHVSFYREEDKVLLPGDAFCTTNQQSFLAVATQKPEMQGPPTYFTPDWDAARRSVETLAGLQADVLAPSHGLTMHGKAATEALNLLARDFVRVAMPKHGHYVDEARGKAGSDAGG